MSSVKETVHDTVDSVKEAFDIHEQVDRHPWAMVAGAVALGFIGGQLLAPRRRGFLPDTWSAGGSRAPMPREDVPQSFAATGRSTPGVLDKLGERFEPALGKLKEMAINAGVGMVGQMILSSVAPAMKKDVAAVIDEVTSALGGKPLHLENTQEQVVTPSDGPSHGEGQPRNRVAEARGNGRHL